MRLTPILAGAAAIAAGGTAGYLGLVTGRLSLDLGVGRRTRELGPLVVDITAPPRVVYDVATAPYARRRPRAMREKVQILDRSEGMVLAAHRTPVGRRLVAVTVETVTFDPPSRVGFRLVRGPVPHLTEAFEFTESSTGTRLTYHGELGTDLGPVGQRWGDLVTRTWIATVQDSVETIRVEAERRHR